MSLLVYYPKPCSLVVWSQKLVDHLRFSLPSASIKFEKITSFASWMEAWNIYLSIVIDHTPARAAEFVAYQHIITSASIQYPTAAWLNYDVQFRTLAASDTTLHWDARHTDLWLQFMTSAKPTQLACWPCKHCGATNHYPDNYPFRPNNHWWTKGCY